MQHLRRDGVRFASIVRSATTDCTNGKLLDSIIRVNHAGELGADRIYAGQMAVLGIYTYIIIRIRIFASNNEFELLLGKTSAGPTIAHMWEQEKIHRAKFEELIQKHRVRPTALLPIWNVAGFILGAGTAMLGEKAAMACTVAVETVIVEHYNDQLRLLMENPEKTDNNEIMETIKKFRDEEQEHHDTGIDHGAEQTPFYRTLTNVIKVGCKTAIKISKVI